jgi:hypothetical protein
MQQAKKKREACRMNLEMSRRVRDRLERLSEESDLTLSEVVRRSLAVYDLLWSEKQNGSTIIVRGSGGEKEIEFV